MRDIAVLRCRHARQTRRRRPLYLRRPERPHVKNKEVEIVTVVGELTFEKHGDQPFMCMIFADED